MLVNHQEIFASQSLSLNFFTMSGETCKLLMKQSIQNLHFYLTKQQFLSYEDFHFEDSRCEYFCQVHPVALSLIGSMFLFSTSLES